MHNGFAALSPTISFLDHQEVVETTSIFLETVPLRASVEIPNNENLFSYELESNGATEMLFGAIELEVPNSIEWTDLLPTTECLDDICPTFLSPPYESLVSEHSLSIEDDSPTTVLHQAERNGAAFINRAQFGQKATHKASASGHSLESRYCGRETSEESLSDMESGGVNSIESIEMGKPRAFLNNEDLAAQKPGVKLSLSLEERHMLRASGWQLPSRFPLTTEEERALRSVRRKIRNKLSAQASRKKRQDYLFELEHRMSVSDKENKRLRRQIAELQNDKRDLVSHVRRLRSYVARLFNRTCGFGTQPRREASTPLPRYCSPVEQEDGSDACLGGSLFPTGREVRTGRENKRMTAAQAAAAGGGTSLLVAAFFILAWTALVPLPSYFRREYVEGLGNASSAGTWSFLGYAGAPQLPSFPVVMKENPLLSGHSRTLLQTPEGDQPGDVGSEQSGTLDRVNPEQKANGGTRMFESVAALMQESVSLMKKLTKVHPVTGDQASKQQQPDLGEPTLPRFPASGVDVAGHEPSPAPPRQLVQPGSSRAVVA